MSLVCVFYQTLHVLKVAIHTSCVRERFYTQGSNGGQIFSFFLVIVVLSVLCLKVGPSSSKRKCVIFFIESTLKMMKNRFLFHLESSFKFSRYLRFCHDFLVYKNKVNFKIHDVTSWLRSTCSRHIAQYRTK